MTTFLVLSLGLSLFGLVAACSDTSDPDERVAPLVQRIAELEEQAAVYEFRIADYEETIAEYEIQLGTLKRPQTKGDAPVAPDTVGRLDWANEGVEVRLTPGVIAGEHWIGRVTGSGFPPGMAVYSVGCLGSYASFNAELCDYANPTVMLADANGDITSGIISVPTDPNGGCALVGTNGPDGAPGSGDEIGALVCYEPRVSTDLAMPRDRTAEAPFRAKARSQNGRLHPDAGRTVMLGEAWQRPARLRIPSSYDGETLLPLLLLLHGYTSTSARQDAYMGFSRQIDTDRYLLLLPEGRKDRSGAQFWNATDACCDIYQVRGDDVSYLMGLIGEAQDTYAIDADRVWVVGHSNGGFMSFRLACNNAPIAAIVSLAGSDFADGSACEDASPLRVLQIHGDQDRIININGTASLGPGLGGFPSAGEVVERWAQRGGCDLSPEVGARRDLDRLLPEKDTDVLVYASGCAIGARAELWTIVGGSHIPALQDDFAERVVSWLMAG